VRRSAAPAAALAVALAALVAGCGGAGGDDPGAKGTFTVSVPQASFPARQGVARTAKLVLAVRNDGNAAITDVAVTIEAAGEGTSALAFQRRNHQPGMAVPSDALWIVDQGPIGGDTAYANTWALGTLPAGGTKRFVWRVTPVVPGRHRITWSVAPGLGNQGTATLAGGGAPRGAFAVSVIGKAPRATVDPRTGRVVNHP